MTVEEIWVVWMRVAKLKTVVRMNMDAACVLYEGKHV